MARKERSNPERVGAQRQIAVAPATITETITLDKVDEREDIAVRPTQIQIVVGKNGTKLIVQPGDCQLGGLEIEIIQDDKNDAFTWMKMVTANVCSAIISRILGFFT